jgi:signal peptidase I
VLAAASVTVAPRLLPVKTFAVASASMEPTVPVGSMIVTVPVSADRLRVGDVITFHRPGDGTLVTHRIARIEEGADGRYFVTRGDANGSDDGWVVPARGTGLRCVFHVPYLGMFVGHPVGRMGLLVVAMVVLSVVALMEIWRRPSPAVPVTRSAHHGSTT